MHCGKELYESGMSKVCSLSGSIRRVKPQTVPCNRLKGQQFWGGGGLFFLHSTVPRKDCTVDII